MSVLLMPRRPCAEALSHCRGYLLPACCRGRHLEAVVPDEETALLEQPEVGEPPPAVLTMLRDPANSLSDDFEGNRTGQQALQAGLEAAAESPKHGAAPPHKPMMSTRQLRQRALAQLAKSDTFRRWGLGRCLCLCMGSDTACILIFALNTSS